MFSSVKNTKKLFLWIARFTNFFVVSLVFFLNQESAFADDQDVVNLTVGGAYQYTDNLFLLPSGTTPASLTGLSSRSDSIKVTRADLNVDTHYSLQEFLLDYKVTSNKYQTFSYLDYVANEYKAAWVWSLSPRLTGNIYVQRIQSLASFANYRNNSQQNIVTVQLQNSDFDYAPYGNWHLIGGFMRIDSQNSAIFTQQTSYLSDNLSGGIKYVFNSASDIGFYLRQVDASSINQPLNAALLLDDGYKEIGQEIKGSWVVSGASKFLFNMMHASRTSNNFAQRSFSVDTGGLSYNWDITSKLTSVINLKRDSSSYSDATSSYYVTNTIGFLPLWKISPKLSVNGDAEFGSQSFLGQGYGGSLNQRRDNLSTYSLSVNWSPRDALTALLSLQHLNRASNQATFDYSSNSVTIGAQWEF